MSTHAEKTSKDFSKFFMIDMDERLKTITKSVDDMHARLEEFQTMIYFAKQERINATELLSLIESSNENLSDLFSRIDATESLVEHVKSSLQAIEMYVEKAEEGMGISESATSKVANMLTPLFKKSPEKRHPTYSQQNFQTSNYFK